MRSSNHSLRRTALTANLGIIHLWVVLQK